MGQTSQAKPLTWDARSFRIDHQRELMISGEIHFARSPRELWPVILDNSAACGLNWIASYVFWNWHEIERDRFDFTGDRDIRHFIDLCAQRNLKVFLRIGPYCCAEWNYGGFPPYLRDEPGVVFRTFNQPFMNRVEKYFDRLIAEIRPCLASHGGPVHLVQVENEYANVAKRYGKDGHRYIRWIADVTQKLGVDVPLLMCETGDTALPGVLSAMNGFHIDQRRVDHQRADQPDVPLVWTEFWTAWYDTWGYQHHCREPQNIAFHLLDFIGRGGSAWNYYMWHGGTNFGRTSMYLQTTSYDFGAPLDEFGGVTAKGVFLAEIHKLLRDHQELLLAGERVIDRHCITWSLGDRKLSMEIDSEALSVRVLDGNEKALLDTSADFRRISGKFPQPKWESLAPLEGWQSWPEPMPSDRRDAPKLAPEPVEQLLLTGDQSDYCWYSAEIQADRDGVHSLNLDRCGDVLTIYIDGHHVARTQPPLAENRGPTVSVETPIIGAEVNSLEQQFSHFSQQFSLQLGKGKHQLDILTASLGLIKGDWQISLPMQFERKGIWQPVSLDGNSIKSWSIRPCLAGELLGVDRDTSKVPWEPLKSPKPCAWHRVRFDLSAADLAAGHDFRLDASGLGKGMIFINGRSIGRHWLIEGRGYGSDDTWHLPQPAGLYIERDGEPTQRYYHVPRAWLKPHNELLIFEEYETAVTSKVRLQRRKSSALSGA